jgi:hypothetical protein
MFIYVNLKAVLFSKNLSFFSSNVFKYFFNVAGRIQISSCTSMMLEVVGGYVTEERGTIEVKVTTNKKKSQ